MQNLVKSLSQASCKLVLTLSHLYRLSFSSTNTSRNSNDKAPNGRRVGRLWLLGIARYDNINDIYFLVRFCLSFSFSFSFSFPFFLSSAVASNFFIPLYGFMRVLLAFGILLELELNRTQNFSTVCHFHFPLFFFIFFSLLVSVCFFFTFCYLKYFKDFSIFYLNTLFR